jgi:glutaredoxin
MYSTEFCGDCRAARAFLDQNQVPFEEVKLEGNNDAVQRVIQANHGKRSVPTFEIDGVYLNCSPFTPEKRKALAIALGLEA